MRVSTRVCYVHMRWGGAEREGKKDPKLPLHCQYRAHHKAQCPIVWDHNRSWIKSWSLSHLSHPDTPSSGDINYIFFTSLLPALFSLSTPLPCPFAHMDLCISEANAHELPVPQIAGFHHADWGLVGAGGFTHWQAPCQDQAVSLGTCH